MGGLARRATYLKRFLKEHAGTPVFQVDAGGLFSLHHSQQSHSRALLEGIGKLGVDIMNLTPADARELERLGLAGKVKQPLLVSANVFGPGRRPLAPPFAVRRGSGANRIVFVGLSSAATHESFGYTVESPREALRRVLPQARQDGDLVVVLAYLSSQEAVDIAANVPGVDVIVSAYDQQLGIPPFQVGSAWILQAQYEGRFVGHAGLQVGAGKLEKIAPQMIVGLDASYADDPEMAELVQRAKANTASAAAHSR